MDVDSIVPVLRVRQRPEDLILHDFRKPEDRGERRPQLMAHIGEKLGFCAICRLRTECRLAQLAVFANEFVQHLVERAGQTMQLLRHVLRKIRCANAEIALRDRPGCGLDSLERTRDIPCEAPAMIAAASSPRKEMATAAERTCSACA